jgi:hypothetical protein
MAQNLHWPRETVKKFLPFVSALAAVALTAPANAQSLCSSEKAIHGVKEIVQNAVPEWSVNLASDFGNWARIERVKNLTKVTEVSSIRALSRDNDTKLTNCAAKVTFALDDHTMSPELSYTVQPLEDKPDTLHVEVESPYRMAVINRAPAPAPVTTVVINNPPPAASAPQSAPTPVVVPVPVMVAPPPVDNLTCWELKLARNEVFARRGYAFKNYELNAYFTRQSWYRPFIADVSTIILSPMEDRQVDIIKTAEAKKGCVSP